MPKWSFIAAGCFLLNQAKKVPLWSFGAITGPRLRPLPGQRSSIAESCAAAMSRSADLSKSANQDGRRLALWSTWRVLSEYFFGLYGAITDQLL